MCITGNCSYGRVAIVLRRVAKGKKMFRLADFIRLLKRYAKNKKISDVDFFNGIISPFVIAGHVHNKKNGEEFYKDKSRVSEIMNNKVDVPQELREALSIYGIEEKTYKNLKEIAWDFLNRDLEEELKVELSKRIEVSDCKETERLLTKAMLLAISTDNTTWY